MLSLLSSIPGADIGKIRSFECDAAEVERKSIPPDVDFAFIDGEHTNGAVRRDFEAVRRFMAKECVIAFHDCFFTPIGILRIAARLRRAGERHHAMYLPKSDVVAIVFGSEAVADALERFGWTRKLPMTYGLGIRMYLKRKLPRLASLFIRSRDALSTKK